jgi:hypothetical protein
VDIGGTVTRGLTGNGQDFVECAAGITIPFTIQPPAAAPPPPPPPLAGTVVELAGLQFTLSVAGGNPLTAAYIGGTITVAGGAMNISAIDVANSAVTVAARANMTIRLTDDDNAAGFPWHPDTMLMRNSDFPRRNPFAPAYIRPVYDGGGDPANNSNLTTGAGLVPFYLNTEAADVYVGVGGAGVHWGSRGNNSERFWVAYILGAWQDAWRDPTGDNLPLGHDRDPDAEGTTFGSTAAGAGGTLVYYEQLREHGYLGGPDGQRTTIHEVGHALRLIDKYNGVAADGIMYGFDLNNVPIDGNDRFIDADLNSLRRILQPNPQP